MNCPICDAEINDLNLLIVEGNFQITINGHQNATGDTTFDSSDLVEKLAHAELEDSQVLGCHRCFKGG